MNTDQVRRCPACRKGDLKPATRMRSFHPNGERLEVTLLTSRCPICGAEAASATQHAENLKLLAARKARYGACMMGEEILALRRRYGITQQQAAKLFGKGKIAFSRYEHETSYPDSTMSKLLALAAEKPSVVRWLADKVGVELPLWQARCNEELGVKLSVVDDRLTVVKAQRWSQEINERSRAAQPVGTLGLWCRQTHSLETQTANDARYENPQEQFA